MPEYSLIGLMSAPELVISTIAIFIGSTILGTVGFGIGLTATPLLLLAMDPRSAVIIVNTISLPINAILIYKSWGHVQTNKIRPIVAGGLLGVPVGVLVLESASDAYLRIGIVCLIMLGASCLAFNFNLRNASIRSGIIGPIAGFIVSVMITSLAVGGPFLVILFLARGWPLHAIRASLAVYFFGLHFLAVIGYGITGLYTEERVGLALVLVLPALLGFYLGILLIGKMTENTFRRTAIAVIMGGSAIVLAKEVWVIGGL